jgi:large subunit ribosomal protein L16
MANIPNKEKFRKRFKLKTDNLPKASSNVELSFGDYGLRAMENGRLTEKQIESARKAMIRTVRPKGKIIKKIFPHWPVTKKPVAVRMGKGKGPVEHHASPVLAGNIIFEIDGVDADTADMALNLAKYKLPFKTKIVHRY